MSLRDRPSGGWGYHAAAIGIAEFVRDGELAWPPDATAWLGIVALVLAAGLVWRLLRDVRPGDPR